MAEFKRRLSKYLANRKARFLAGFLGLGVHAGTFDPRFYNILATFPTVGSHFVLFLLEARAGCARINFATREYAEPKKKQLALLNV